MPPRITRENLPNDVLVEWRYGTYKLHIGEPLRYTGDNVLRTYVSYKFWDDDKLIFQGSDFSPGMLGCIDSDESVYSLLGFLSLAPGDTDADHFKSYTPEQLAWVKDNHHELSMLVSDFEDPQAAEPNGY